MRRVALKVTQSQTVDRDDQTAMTEALSRLYGAATQSISDIVSNLSASERARLAVFCYGRAHLNAIGLAIAATCDLDHLAAASNSATAGQTLFVQSREASTEKPSIGRRPAITLASAGTMVSFLAQQPAELTA